MASAGRKIAGPLLGMLLLLMPLDWHWRGVCHIGNPSSTTPATTHSSPWHGAMAVPVTMAGPVSMTGTVPVSFIGTTH